MLRLSKLTDYATIVLTALAKEPGAVRNAAELAQSTHITAPTVSKALKRLSQSGLVESVRGAGGGYRLAQSPKDISMADVVAAIEGPIAMTECSHSQGQCALEQHCQVRPHWQVINQTIINSLKKLSLNDLVQPTALPQ